ncbi:uncharacterized protein LOC128669195 [Plodia interpunctella]|uniref:uncharacterized protein LOC128669195 n=1 Tax=Plodia interpunctella TaxID=58824 RepID=UPI0023686C3F|nr:uncharacterized protein LOC128669195 [Plodia interpunctella]
MEVLKLLFVICCSYYCYASEKSHVIPVEGYETELENLGQHVEIPETPVKVIKITKTIAVKVPVPYPVKVREKVPYPVPISKPYPVPVPQIIKVPHLVHTKSDQTEHDSGNTDSGYGGFQGSHQLGGGIQNSYQVQEEPGHDYVPFAPRTHPFKGYSTGNEQNFHDSSEGSNGNSYGDAPFNYNGYSGNNGDESSESKSYDNAIKDYLEKHQLGGGTNSAAKSYY